MLVRSRCVWRLSSFGFRLGFVLETWGLVMSRLPPTLRTRLAHASLFWDGFQGAQGQGKGAIARSVLSGCSGNVSMRQYSIREFAILTVAMEFCLVVCRCVRWS